MVRQMDWSQRERQWQRKLRRLKLDAEPIEEQLARLRGVTIALTAVPLTIALMFVGLFAAFGAATLGAIVAAIILLPVVAVAWIDYALLARGAARYLRERRAAQEEASPPAGRAGGGEV